MAVKSGPAAAAARRIPPTVVSATCADWSAGQYEVVTVVIAQIVARRRGFRPRVLAESAHERGDRGMITALDWDGAPATAGSRIRSSA